jgi:outer membrane protein W
MNRRSSSNVHRSRRGAGLLVAAIAAAATLPAAEAREGGRWTIRASGALWSPAGDQVSLMRGAGELEERALHTVDSDATALGVGVDYRLTRRLAIVFTATFLDLDNDFVLENPGGPLRDTESMRVESFALGVDWHPMPDRRADLRVGLFTAQTTFDDVIFLTELGRRDKLTFDDDYGFGVVVGVDWPLRAEGSWLVAAELRYLATILESEVAGEDLDYDPLAVGVTLGYRF